MITRVNRIEDAAHDSLAAGGVASFVTRKSGKSLASSKAKLGDSTDGNLKKRHLEDGSKPCAKKARAEQKLGGQTAKSEAVEPSKEVVAKESSGYVSDETAAMQKEIKQMEVELNESKERTRYWKRQSCDLQTLLSQKEKSMNKTTSKLEEKIEALTNARLELQSKLASENAATEEGITEITRLVEVQAQLEDDKKLLFMEIENMESECASAKQERETQINELRDALETTLGDLKKKIGELKKAKEALQRAKARLAKINESNDQNSKEDLKRQCGRREERIEVLSEMVEKLVFKASVLSQTNAELRGKLDGTAEAQVPVGLKEPNKMKLLENMCMSRFKKIMVEAASRMNTATNEKSTGGNEN